MTATLEREIGVAELRQRLDRGAQATSALDGGAIEAEAVVNLDELG